jgi:RimJ/RimL family protein N-acetyltransferase
MTDAGLLRTDRLILRPMIEADVEPFHALVTRPEVARMLYLFHPGWTLAEARVFLADWVWRGQLRFRLSIVEGGLWQGWIGVSDDAEPEIFYALTAEAAGRGLAREAVAAFTVFLFDRFPVPALTAGVFFDNPASMKVLRACGFVQSHVEDHVSRGRPAPAPCHIFRLPRGTPVAPLENAST